MLKTNFNTIDAIQNRTLAILKLTQQQCSQNPDHQKSLAHEWQDPEETGLPIKTNIKC